jgi:cadmium resistance transport/sequestration family protein
MTQMEWIVTTIFTGTAAFVATNIDDIFVLMLFYSQLSATFRRRHVVAGQYLGFAALVAISLLGFLGSLVVPREWIGLLGLLPIAIGIRKFIRQHETIEKEEFKRLERQSSKSSLLAGLLSWQTLSVVTVTFANGGDNIGIYVPLFASSNLARLSAILSTFFVLLAVWCYIGYLFARHPAVANILPRYAHSIVPFVFIALGVYILIENDTLKLLGL